MSSTISDKKSIQSELQKPLDNSKHFNTLSQISACLYNLEVVCLEKIYKGFKHVQPILFFRNLLFCFMRLLKEKNNSNASLKDQNYADDKVMLTSDWNCL